MEDNGESKLLPFTHTALPDPLQTWLDTKDTHTPPNRKLIPKVGLFYSILCGDYGLHPLRFQNHPITHTLHYRPPTGPTNSLSALFQLCRCRR